MLHRVTALATVLAAALAVTSANRPPTFADLPPRENAGIFPTDVARSNPPRQDERQAPTTIPQMVQPMPGDCEAYTAIAAAVGWPQSEIDTVRSVLFRESRCDPTQHNHHDPLTGSYGLFQVNAYWCLPNRYWPDGWLQDKRILGNCKELFTPEINALAALAIYRHSGWRAWGMK